MSFDNRWNQHTHTSLTLLLWLWAPGTLNLNCTVYGKPFPAPGHLVAPPLSYENASNSVDSCVHVTVKVRNWKLCLQNILCITNQ